MRPWHRNLRDIGWSLGATRNEGLGPNSIGSAPNLRRAPIPPEALTTLEARQRFSDQRRPPDQRRLSGECHEGRWFVERGQTTNRSRHRPDRTTGFTRAPSRPLDRSAALGPRAPWLRPALAAHSATRSRVAVAS